MRGKPHSAEVRAQVLADLAAGRGVNEVAEQYGLDKSVVSRWRLAAEAGRLQPVATAPIVTKQADEIGELLGGYLRRLLTTLTTQAEVAGKPAWIESQPAGELALLHGVLCDRAIRLLEAAERAAEAGSPVVPQLGELG